jgi:hypothetical protein
MLRGVREWPDGYKICIVDLTHISFAQRQQSACSTRSRYEFDLETVRLINFNDCTEIAALESMLRKIAVENDGV